MSEARDDIRMFCEPASHDGRVQHVEPSAERQVQARSICRQIFPLQKIRKARKTKVHEQRSMNSHKVVAEVHGTVGMPQGAFEFRFWQALRQHINYHS